MARKKVLLIGVDQSIPYLLNKFVDEGVLPHIKFLMDTGTYAEGLSCAPCDTPTNWTTIATGATTPVHGATSFYTHIPGEELDYGASVRSRSQLAEYTSAEYIWETADKQKIPSFVLNYPAGWPAKLEHGVMSAFTWPIPKTLPRIIKPNKQMKFSTNAVKDKYLITDNTFSYKISQETTIEFKIHKAKVISFSHQYLNYHLEEGEWSQWVASSRLYRGKSVPILVRFQFNSVPDDLSSVELKISPIFNTSGWTSPSEFGDLILRHVKFPEQNPTKSDVGYTFEGEMSEVIEFAQRETQAIADCIYLAKRQLDWDLCYFHIHHLDTINHNALARILPDYPLYDETIAEKTMNHVRKAYSVVDDMVGRLLNQVIDKNTTIVYVSDHGAIPCWRVINIVKPLVDAGLMVYKKEGNRYKIDWSKTQVFPYMEPNYAWVNLKGRDPQGIVDPSDYESVRDHTINVLQGLKDPENNRPIMDLVMRKEDHPELHQNGDRIGDIVYFLNSPFNIFDGDLSLLNAANTILPDKPVCYGSKEIFGAHAYYKPKKRFGPFSNSVPIIINNLKENQGKKLGGFTELIDIAPTIAHILDIPKPKQSQGKIMPIF